jgi:hypothetical protein
MASSYKEKYEQDRAKQAELLKKDVNLVPDSVLTRQNNDILTRQNQIAADKAHENEAVMLRDPNLPQEVQNFANPDALVANRAPADLTSTQSFTNPSAPQGQSASTGQTLAAPVAPAVPTAPATPRLYDESGDVDKVIQGFEEQNRGFQKEAEDIQKQKELAIQQQIENDAKSLPQVKPTDIFAGKATWQKILGGIGLFLGSLTPEGAKNVANMIDKEIERDQQLQLNNIKLKQDKDDRHFKNLMQKYGSQEAALSAKKADAFGMVKLHIEKLGLASKNAHNRATLQLAYKQAENEESRYRAAAYQAALKAQKEDQKGSVPGYEGAPLDPATKREFTGMLASADTIRGSLSELSQVIKGTGEAIPFTQSNYRAKQLVNDVQLQLKEIKKLGVLSGADSVRLDSYISNPSIFKSDSRMQAEIKGVTDLVNKAIAAYEKRLGQYKIMPRDFRGKSK